MQERPLVLQRLLFSPVDLTGEESSACGAGSSFHCRPRPFTAQLIEQYKPEKIILLGQANYQFFPKHICSFFEGLKCYGLVFGIEQTIYRGSACIHFLG